MAVIKCKCRIENRGICTCINDHILCPRCGRAVLKHYDYHARSLKFSDRETQVFYLERRRCPNPECRSVHLLVPDFMVLHKHYAMVDIELVMSVEFTIKSLTYYDRPSVSTVIRWKHDSGLKGLTDT